MTMCIKHSLKCDDVNLKGYKIPASDWVCAGLDPYALENIHHIVMQCPTYLDTRLQIYAGIRVFEGEIPLTLMLLG